MKPATTLFDTLGLKNKDEHEHKTTQAKIEHQTDFHSQNESNACLKNETRNKCQYIKQKSVSVVRQSKNIKKHNKKIQQKQKRDRKRR
jgi:hypothetical protein